MTERNVYQPTRLSPTGLTAVIALHAAAIGGLMMWKIAMPGPEFGPTRTYHVPFVPPPEPTPAPQRSEDTALPRQAPSFVDQPPAHVPAPPTVFDIGPALPHDLVGAPPGDLVVPEQPRAQPLPVPIPVPIPDPVRVGAEIDPRYRAGLQPPYPASEQRNEREGTVRVRVTIGTDGRVKAAEQVSATSDAFWQATRSQALRFWRFRPATVDGRPVESEQVMTVTFRLSDL